MKDLKDRITSLIEEIIYVHLRDHWVEKLVASGVKREEAIIWAVEIGEVVDEYSGNLRRLTEVLSVEADLETLAEEVYDWVAYVQSFSISEIQAPLKRLESRLEPYLPPDEE